MFQHFIISKFSLKQLTWFSILSFILTFLILLLPTIIFAPQVGTYILYLVTFNEALLLGYMFWITFISIIGWIWLLHIIHYLKYKERLRFNFWSLTLKQFWFWFLVWLWLFLFWVLYSKVLTLTWLNNSDTTVESNLVTALVLQAPLASLFFLTMIWMSEELFFRGILQRWLYKFWPYIAIIISSIIFTLLHWSQYWWLLLLEVFLLSSVLWYIYYKYDNMLLNMLIHWTNNFLAILFIIISTFLLSTERNIESNLFLDYFWGTKEIKNDIFWTFYNNCNWLTFNEVWNDNVQDTQRNVFKEIYDQPNLYNCNESNLKKELTEKNQLDLVNNF